jgi:glycosyltransferase involved in cell wall biosynthesis
MGIPAVVTTECGAKQYIINGKSGFIIPPNDDNALANAVLVITKSKKTSREMGKIDQDCCRIAISKDTMRAGLLSLYEEVLKH